MPEKGSAFRFLFFLVCVGIVYGSLFPFQFSADVDRDVIARFLQSWRIMPGLGDVLGNIALFVPFGFLARTLAVQPRPARLSSGSLLMAWLVVAAGSQAVQFFLPSRDPAVFDLYSNALGALAGWLLARWVPAGRLTAWSPATGLAPVPLVLVLLWLAAELIPFVPTIDFHAYKVALKPLLLAPKFEWYECVYQAAAWLACLHLLVNCASLSLRLPQLVIGAVAVLFAKVLIITNSVSLTDVVAMLAAIAVWSLAGRDRFSGVGIGVLLMLGLTLESIFPFLSRMVTAGLGWIPFSGFLEGSMLSNAAALCRKLFLFGAIGYLMVWGSATWRSRTAGLALWLLLLEVVQKYVYAGTPEITDPLLFVAVTWFAQRYGLPSGRIPAAGPTYVSQPEPDPGTVQPAVNRAKTVAAEDASLGSVGEASLLSTLSERRRVLVAVAVFCLLTVVALKTVLGLPGIPYNVRELFRFGANGIDLLFFSLLLLSIGWGSAWLSHVLATTTRPLRDIPAVLLGASAVSYALLWLSVTRESIRDITGSTVFVNRVMERGVLGEPGVRVIELFGRENVHALTRLVEPVIRFAALVAPLLLFFSLSLALWSMRRNTVADVQRSPRVFITGGVCLLVLLWLAKAIAFDWSSTDNLNELIARDGLLGSGGGGYLYLLVLTLAVASAALTVAWREGARQWLVAGLIAVLAVPISWWLLNHGLEPNVGKYGYTFSGVDFLLGPDRATLLSDTELFLRWTVVSLAGVAGLAFSAGLALGWRGRSVNATVPVARAKPAVRAEPPTARSKPVELRVYTQQLDFLNSQAMTMHLSVEAVVAQILDYFARELTSSPASVESVQAYIAQKARAEEVEFAPTPVHVTMSSGACDLMTLVDPLGTESDSRKFRKMLEIFIQAAEEEHARDDDAPAQI